MNTNRHLDNDMADAIKLPDEPYDINIDYDLSILNIPNISSTFQNIQIKSSDIQENFLPSIAFEVSEIINKYELWYDIKEYLLKKYPEYFLSKD